jgi:hypothetical protein
MKPKEHVENLIRGWLPKESGFPILHNTAHRRILSKSRLLWLCAGLTVAMLVIGTVFFAFFLQNIWRDVDASMAESEKTMSSFVAALSNHDAAAAWSLMSPALQASYGTKENFSDTVITELREYGWHAQVLSVISIGGDFTLPGSLIQSSARIRARLQITQRGVFSNETHTFDLVKPSEWRINSMPAITRDSTVLQKVKA